jgi:hypothetical protein
MEHEKIIFLRNLFLRMFVVGIVIALLLLGATLAFWNVAAGWVMHLFSVEEKTLGRIVLTFFTNVRIVVLFFFLVPAIALHWMAKKD